MGPEKKDRKKNVEGKEKTEEVRRRQAIVESKTKNNRSKQRKNIQREVTFWKNTVDATREKNKDIHLDV